MKSALKKVRKLAEDFETSIHFPGSNLGRSEVGAREYPRLFDKILQLIRNSNSSTEDKEILKSELRHVISLFQQTKDQLEKITSGVKDPFTNVIAHLELVGEKLLEELRSKDKRSTIIPETFQEERFDRPFLDNVCEKYRLPDFKKLPSSCLPVYLIGGLARVIAHEKFGIDVPSGELPITDFDVVVANYTSLEIVSGVLGIDPKEIKVIQGGQGSISKLLSGFDLNFTHIACEYSGGEKGRVIFSLQAKESLEKGIIYPATVNSQDFFGENFIEKGKTKIYTPRMLERLIKFVAEGKARGFRLQDHNFNVQLEKQLLNMLRKFIEKGLNKRIETFWRLLEILQQMGVGAEADFFQYLDKQIGAYPRFNFHPLPPDSITKANWFITKVIGLVMRKIDPVREKILSLSVYQKKRLSKRDLKYREIVVEYDNVPAKEFREKFIKWRMRQTRFPSV